MSVSYTLNGKAVDELPGIGQKVALDPDTKAALNSFLQANLENPEYRKFIAGGSGSTPDDESEAEPRSAARKRLEKLKAQATPEIVPFEFDGETYHIRRLHYQGLIDLALSVARDGDNVLQAGEAGGVRAVTTAVLLACVCNEDGTPFFEYSDVAAYLEEPAAASFVSALFLQCNMENPDILNTLKKT